MWPSERLGVDGDGRKGHCVLWGSLPHSHLSQGRKGSHFYPEMWSTSVPHDAEMWHWKLYPLCCAVCACPLEPGHPGPWRPPGFLWTCCCPSLLCFRTHIVLTAVGTLHGNATDSPGTYTCCIIEIIRLILFLMLQIKKDNLPFRMKVLSFLCCLFFEIPKLRCIKMFLTPLLTDISLFSRAS